MRQNIIRIAMLLVLVVLCMWQIVILWLGDMSGHNFLEKTDAAHNIILVQPKSMWVNVGKLAYKIDETKREYGALIDELGGLVKDGAKSATLQEHIDLGYEDVLTMPGILYEYDLAIGIKDLMGSVLEDLETDIMIDQVFVDMSLYNDHKTNLYLISEDTKNIDRVTIYNRLEAHQKMITRFNNPEVTRSLIGYQPTVTSNKKQYIKSDGFYPLNTKDTPIAYEVLQVTNPIEQGTGEKRLEALEGYVNSFFANPLLKTVSEGEDGSIVFSENIKAVVKYDPSGTLEFSMTSVSQQSKLTGAERLKMVMDFIETCSGIPGFLKEGMYLSGIVSQDEEYVYQFNYKHKGFGVHLTNQVKQQLGLSHILQISIRNNQVVGGKWSILDIDTHTETGVLKDQVVRGFDEIVDTMYERYIAEGYQDRPLDVVQCRYIMDTLEGSVKLNWVVLFEGNWYYP
jgi:hypothetical protein